MIAIHLSQWKKQMSTLNTMTHWTGPVAQQVFPIVHKDVNKMSDNKQWDKMAFGGLDGGST